MECEGFCGRNADADDTLLCKNIYFNGVSEEDVLRVFGDSAVKVSEVDDVTTSGVFYQVVEAANMCFVRIIGLCPLHPQTSEYRPPPVIELTV